MALKMIQSMCSMHPEIPQDKSMSCLLVGHLCSNREHTSQLPVDVSMAACSPMPQIELSIALLCSVQYPRQAWHQPQGYSALCTQSQMLQDL